MIERFNYTEFNFHSRFV